MGGIALVLALMGVYSLIAYLAARRTQEFGVRMALGATRWQVIRLNVRQALVITGLGLAMGTAIAIVLGRVMASALFGLVSLEVMPIAAMVVVARRHRAGRRVPPRTRGREPGSRRWRSGPP